MIQENHKLVTTYNIALKYIKLKLTIMRKTDKSTIIIDFNRPQS